jgi:hypothetical protein
MTAITYGAHARIETPAKAAPAAKGLLRRFYDALIEARLAQAQRELELHRHLLPGEYEIAAEKLNSKSEDSLPFAR